ncbi:thiamine phosphate synthase [Nocardioides kongjuensis]|uniref:Thiamine-phosphate pyrophosphorylase n=1 Tax=Nocardioides kongjuensis TaxID=349522 RepID=A0A852RF52_9ACTN|nr:thiamine phosphate synthase [Nocardioides kongjuensis]NYD29358.1 thiamine-phosphate pyrophosphorylase [Nocardioides kongjuensis]
MDLPRLLVLTDRSQLHLGRSLARTVAECVSAGATHVVVRELDETELARTALAAACEAAGASVIAAHTPLYGCVGVHLPLGAPVPADLPFGRSCHTADEVRAAAVEGASWVTLGPFASTESKPGYEPVDRAVYDAAAEVGIRVYALGGVTPDNVADAIAAGADGVAVMGSVMRAEDPAAVVGALLDVLGEAPW